MYNWLAGCGVLVVLSKYATNEKNETAGLTRWLVHVREEKSDCQVDEMTGKRGGEILTVFLK